MPMLKPSEMMRRKSVTVVLVHVNDIDDSALTPDPAADPTTSPSPGMVLAREEIRAPATTFATAAPSANATPSGPGARVSTSATSTPNLSARFLPRLNSAPDFFALQTPDVSTPDPDFFSVPKALVEADSYAEVVESSDDDAPADATDALEEAQKIAAMRGSVSRRRSVSIFRAKSSIDEYDARLKMEMQREDIQRRLATTRRRNSLSAATASESDSDTSDSGSRAGSRASTTMSRRGSTVSTTSIEEFEMGRAKNKEIAKEEIVKARRDKTSEDNNADTRRRSLEEAAAKDAEEAAHRDKDRKGNEKRRRRHLRQQALKAKQWQQERQACLVLQQFFRMRQAKSRVMIIKLGIHAAKMQAGIRNMIARKRARAARKLRIFRDKNAVIVQAIARGYLVLLGIHRNKAARYLQPIIMRQCRYQRDKHNAATVLQSFRRMLPHRRRFREQTEHLLGVFEQLLALQGGVSPSPAPSSRGGGRRGSINSITDGVPGSAGGCVQSRRGSVTSLIGDMGGTRSRRGSVSSLIGDMEGTGSRQGSVTNLLGGMGHLMGGLGNLGGLGGMRDRRGSVSSVTSISSATMSRRGSMASVSGSPPPPGPRQLSVAGAPPGLGPRRLSVLSLGVGPLGGLSVKVTNEESSGPCPICLERAYGSYGKWKLGYSAKLQTDAWMPIDAPQVDDCSERRDGPEEVAFLNPTGEAASFSLSGNSGPESRKSRTAPPASRKAAGQRGGGSPGSAGVPAGARRGSRSSPPANFRRMPGSAGKTIVTPVTPVIPVTPVTPTTPATPATPATLSATHTPLDRLSSPTQERRVPRASVLSPPPFPTAKLTLRPKTTSRMRRSRASSPGRVRDSSPVKFGTDDHTTARQRLDGDTIAHFLSCAKCLRRTMALARKSCMPSPNQDGEEDGDASRAVSVDDMLEWFRYHAPVEDDKVRPQSPAERKHEKLLEQARMLVAQSGQRDLVGNNEMVTQRVTQTVGRRGGTGGQNHADKERLSRSLLLVEPRPTTAAPLTKLLVKLKHVPINAHTSVSARTLIATRPFPYVILSMKAIEDDLSLLDAMGALWWKPKIALYCKGWTAEMLGTLLKKRQLYSTAIECSDMFLSCPFVEDELCRMLEVPVEIKMVVRPPSPRYSPTPVPRPPSIALRLPARPLSRPSTAPFSPVQRRPTTAVMEVGMSGTSPPPALAYMTAWPPRSPTVSFDSSMSTVPVHTKRGPASPTRAPMIAAPAQTSPNWDISMLNNMMPGNRRCAWTDILLIDSDKPSRSRLRKTLCSQIDARVLSSSGGSTALKLISSGLVGVVIADIRLLHTVGMLSSSMHVPLILLSKESTERSQSSVKARECRARGLFQTPLSGQARGAMIVLARKLVHHRRKQNHQTPPRRGGARQGVSAFTHIS